jgi:NADH:ubiquinone oxidoreductase subunit 6 (subunit J)
MEGLTLFLFQTTALFSLIFLVNLRNPVHSVFLLILVFANIGAILLFLQIEFLALVYNRISRRHCSSFLIRRYDA